MSTGDIQKRLDLIESQLDEGADGDVRAVNADPSEINDVATIRLQIEMAEEAKRQLAGTTKGEVPAHVDFGPGIVYSDGSAASSDGDLKRLNDRIKALKAREKALAMVLSQERDALAGALRARRAAGGR